MAIHSGRLRRPIGGATGPLGGYRVSAASKRVRAAGEPSSHDRLRTNPIFPRQSTDEWEAPSLADQPAALYMQCGRCLLNRYDVVGAPRLIGILSGVRCHYRPTERSG